jgi:hypothetical protein
LSTDDKAIDKMMNIYVSPRRQKLFEPKNISQSPCHHKTTSLKQCKSDTKVMASRIQFYSIISKHKQHLLNSITSNPIKQTGLNQMPSLRRDLLTKIMAKLPRLITTPLHKLRGVRINQQKDLEKAYSLRALHKRAQSLKP